MSAPQKITSRGSQSVSSTELSVGGDTNWTVERSSGDRAYRVTVVSGGDAYFAVVPEGTSLTGAVSSTLYDLLLSAQESGEIRVPTGNYLAVVSASTSTVRYVEYTYKSYS